MKPEAQRIAIAEACPQALMPDLLGAWYRANHTVGGPAWLPCGDPLEDLNACHELEKMLTKEQGQTWAGLLCDMTDRFDGDAWKHAAYSLARATAAQRVEAFLKTIGLWKDEP